MSTTHINDPIEQTAKHVAIQLGGEVLLRDYFAAKAMQVDYELVKQYSDPDWRIGVALDAYKMADAMLKARSMK